MKTLLQSKMSSSLIIAIVVVFCLGCATQNQIETPENTSVKQIQIMQQQSAGTIQCPSEQIEITGYKINKTDGSAFWTAFGCNGNTYKCTRSSKDHQDVNCKKVEPDLINQRGHWTFQAVYDKLRISFTLYGNGMLEGKFCLTKDTSSCENSDRKALSMKWDRVPSG